MIGFKMDDDAVIEALLSPEPVVPEIGDCWWKPDLIGNLTEQGRADVTDVYYSERGRCWMVVVLAVGKHGERKRETHERDRFSEAYQFRARAQESTHV